MPKRLVIKGHLSLEELEIRYKKAKDGTLQSHYQIIWLLAKGHLSEEVSAITGYSRSWIYELVWGYNRVGPSSLGDKRAEGLGRKGLLSEAQLQALYKAVNSKVDKEPWNPKRVREWISDVLGRDVHYSRGADYLKRVKSMDKPRPLKNAGVKREKGVRVRRVKEVTTEQSL